MKNLKLYAILGLIVIAIYGIIVVSSNSAKTSDAITTSDYVKAFNSAKHNNHVVAVVSYGSDDDETYHKIASVIKQANDQSDKTKSDVIVVKYGKHGNFDDLRKKYLGDNKSDGAQVKARVALSRDKSLLGDNTVFDRNGTDVINIMKSNEQQKRLPTTVSTYALIDSVWLQQDSVVVKDSNQSIVKNMLTNKMQ